MRIGIEAGRLLAAKFACTSDICNCYAEVNGDWYQAELMQPGMEEPKYRFLLSMISFFDLPQPAEGSVITLTGRRPIGVPFKALSQNGSRAPIRPQVRLPICAILHTGKLTDLSAEAAAIPEAAEPLTV